MEAAAGARRQEDGDGDGVGDGVGVGVGLGLPRCPEAGEPLPAEEQRQEQEEEESLHLAKRRKLLCCEFVAITCSDAVVAQSFLAGNDWHLERALDAYFEPPTEKEVEKTEASEVPACRGAPIACIDLTDDAATSSDGVNSADLKQQEDDSSFSLLTWNIDGLDVGNLIDRARGVCTYLTLYSPDVVFLQEVVPPHLGLLQKRLGNYTVIPGNTDGYFTAIMLKKSRVKLLKHEIIAFPTTSMMRNLLTVHVRVSGVELCLMTSHLESTKTHSKERVKQLEIVLKRMQEEPESTTVIFGGDTNLRDSEVAKLGKLPGNVVDIWELLGRPEHCRYTWDTTANSNLSAAYKCRTRFDRLYLRPAAAEEGCVTPQSMDLVGLEKLDCGRFPSDHWGLLCNFSVTL